MIEFQSTNYKNAIRIRALGYQYPGENDHYWDDNWLKMELEVEKDGLNSIRIDPFLLTWELVDLAKWFRDFPSHPNGEFYMNVENTICFTKLGTRNKDRDDVKNESDTSSANLKIGIHYSLLESSLEGYGEDLILNCQLTEKDCDRIAISWEEISKRFPVIRP